MSDNPEWADQFSPEFIKAIDMDTTRITPTAQLLKALDAGDSPTPPVAQTLEEDKDLPDLHLEGCTVDPKIITAPWTRGLDLGPVNNDYKTNVTLEFVQHALTRAALLDGGAPVLHWSLSGGDHDNILPLVQEFQRRLGLRALTRTCCDPENYFNTLLIRDSDGSAIRVQSNSSEVFVYSRDPEFIRAVDEYWRPLIPKRKREGAVHVMTHTAAGLVFHRIDDCGIPFEPGNYNTDVVQAYRRIVAGLSEKDPVGRISVLTGPPGCGKTYIMKALLQETKDVKFVIVPASYIETMASPEFIPALLNFGRENTVGKEPIVFLIEDADECLAKRDSGNRNAVSALLNFGDGILGSALDIRVVATTNKEINDLDDALARPGRMHTIQEVGPLEAPWEVLGRLMGVKLNEDGFDRLLPRKFRDDHGRYSLTLAQVYSLFRDKDWVRFNADAGLVSRPIGFGS